MKETNIYERKIWRVLGRIGDLVVLNLIYLICCIPIFTIGAAKTALYGVTKKMVKNEESYPVKMFFEQFKENFKQSTIMWLIYIVAVLICVLDLYISGFMGQEMGRMFFMALMCVTLIITNMMLIYALALQSTFINTVGNTIKNSLIMTISHFPLSIVITAFNLSPYIFVIFLTQYIAFEVPVLMFLWFSGVAYINSFMLNSIFQKYM